MLRLALLAVLALVLPPTLAAAQGTAEWARKTVAAPGPLSRLLRLGNAIYLDLGRKAAESGVRYHRLYLTKGTAVLEALPFFLVAPDEWRPDMLPDGLIYFGDNNIREAWLADPTDRYRHGALGDVIEAGTLKAVGRTGQHFSLTLGDDSVFEDRYPRLVDLDGDGRDEIVVVHSYLERGAALAVYAIVDGELRRVAESAPLGQPNRWLNPVGVGDFDGDGRPEVAVVATPHRGGILRLYELADGALRPEGEAEGFSNHVLGSSELQLSAVADLNGDGVPELVLPSADRKTLKIVTFLGGRPTVVAAFQEAHAVVSAIHALDLDGDGQAELVFALDDDSVVVLTRSDG